MKVIQVKEKSIDEVVKKYRPRVIVITNNGYKVYKTDGQYRKRSTK